MSTFPSFKDLPSENKYVKTKFTITEYKIKDIVNKINDIDNLDDNEIKDIIVRQHNTILNYDLFLKDSETRKLAQELFTNKKFLNIFISIINIIPLSEHEKTCLNKLAYDYYILKDKDEEVSNLLLQISNIINYRQVVRLSAYLGMNAARSLSMISDSSFKQEKNIHRINVFLVKCNISLSIQDLVNILCTLFNHFTYPFIYSMLELKPDNLTNEQNKRFDDISLALIAMLDSMTSDDMYKVLYAYGYTLRIYNIESEYVRFKLKELKGYNRIQTIINKVESEALDAIKIP